MHKKITMTNKTYLNKLDPSKITNKQKAIKIVINNFGLIRNEITDPSDTTTNNKMIKFVNKNINNLSFFCVYCLLSKEPLGTL